MTSQDFTFLQQINDPLFQKKLQMTTGKGYNYHMDPFGTDVTRQVQFTLNRMGVTGSDGKPVRVDGIYGTETQQALNKYIKSGYKSNQYGNGSDQYIAKEKQKEQEKNDTDAATVIRGIVPSTTYVSPLQTGITKVGIRNKDQTGNISRMLTDPITNENLFYFDKHGINTRQGKTPDFKHINIKTRENAPSWQENIAQKLDHTEIPKPVYEAFKDFDQVKNVVKTGGKALAVIGAAMDVYEMGSTIADDLNDEDKKLGKKTVSTAASIGGSWAGGAAGGELGAMGGAAIGTLICPGLGTVIGGFLGGIAGGIAGAISGEKVGEFLADLIY